MTGSHYSVSTRDNRNSETEDIGGLHYRRARLDDLPAMASVFLSALADLYARNNILAPVPPQSTVLVDFEHVLETGIFHVAEQNRRVVAIAGAIVRDPAVVPLVVLGASVAAAARHSACRCCAASGRPVATQAPASSLPGLPAIQRRWQPI
jgi:hypothetical protein